MANFSNKAEKHKAENRPNKAADEFLLPFKSPLYFCTYLEKIH